MNATRWALIALAAIVVAAGLLVLGLPIESPLAPAAEPAAAVPRQLHGAPTVSVAAASAPSRPNEPVHAEAAAASAPRIGSEGYGPHIERAEAGNDASAAWEAVRWLRQCAAGEAHRNSAEALRNQGVSPEMMTQLMVEADAEARRCQTVTARHRAMLPELAAQALRAGVPEAAAAYASAVFSRDLLPAQREEVADGMRRDARTGQALSLLGAMLAHESWGLSDTERLGFMSAFLELPNQSEAEETIKSLMAQKLIRFKAAPTPDQRDAAELAAQEIVARARAGRPP